MKILEDGNIKKIKCAVLGCTGIVGQRFIKLLENHPYFKLSQIIASDKNKDKIYECAVNWLIEGEIPYYAKKLKIKIFDIKLLKEDNIKVIFCALPSNIALKIEKILLENGFAVFSNSKANRYKKNVPILIPEVNSSHINLIKSQNSKNKGFIITNANCSTTGLAIALKPLEKFKIKNVFVSTYQALSGAGYPGIASLDINSNVIPFIEGEEEKIEIELKKILGKLNKNIISNKKLKIVTNCARVPVRDGHLESVVIEFEKDIDIKLIKNAFTRLSSIKNLPTSPKKPIIFIEKENRPQPLIDAYTGKPKRARGMSVTVGRLKKQGKWICFWLVVHNTIRGAAGNSILNAEYAFKKGFLNEVT